MVYSKGDRVEVLCEDALYPAEVIKVHPSGKVDVLYSINGCVSLCLTADQHDLRRVKQRPLVAPTGGKITKAVCSVETCSNQADRRGLCSKHRRKPCSVEGCTTKAKAKGVCAKHGALGSCVTPGCTSNATKRGQHCTRHGVKRIRKKPHGKLDELTTDEAGARGARKTSQISPLT